MQPSLISALARRTAVLCILVVAICTAAQAQESTIGPEAQLKQLSLEQLGEIEVTTQSIYVITQEDIKRSGATSIPEVLRLAPGVEVARINASTWSVGIRGFGTDLSRSVLVLIDGRSVYSTFQAGTFWDV